MTWHQSALPVVQGKLKFISEAMTSFSSAQIASASSSSSPHLSASSSRLQLPLSVSNSALQLPTVSSSPSLNKLLSAFDLQSSDVATESVATMSQDTAAASPPPDELIESSIFIVEPANGVLAPLSVTTFVVTFAPDGSRAEKSECFALAHLVLEQVWPPFHVVLS